MDVHNNEKAHRFEVEIEGYTAFLNYQRRGDALVLVHTEVPSQLEGRGVGGNLARTALETARGEGLKVVPHCSFVASYIERHPEYADLRS